MNILIVTKNSIIGEGIALELQSLGYNARSSSMLSQGFDTYVVDIDSCTADKRDNLITFSVIPDKADLKRPFLTEELMLLISKKADTPSHVAPIDVFNEFDTSCLSDTEGKLLEVLLENRGKAVSVNELSRRVWGRDTVKSNIVNVYIRYLRQKLEKDSPNRIIFTVRGQGYKIN